MDVERFVHRNRLMSDLELLTFPVAPLGCNCSIIVHKPTGEAIVVDPGGDAPRIIQLLAERNARVRWIVHTHAHFDHCLGTHAVAEAARENPAGGAVVAMHKEDLGLYRMLDVQCGWFGIPPQKAQETIEHHLEDEETLAFGGRALTVLHTPGHTPGSCCFHLPEEGIVFSGDTLFARGIGRTDLPGGDSEAILKSINLRLFTLDESTAVIPGHGGFTRIFEEKRMNPFF